ncbi:integrase arm-type DNA-binding domain-containing protein [Vibrio parahaemolyticus]|nr:integrase arm-type DNA-binding domain-containing protein [Vibrio parahaemolyticus]
MLSDSKLRSYYGKKREKQLVLSDRDGLYVRVSTAGGVSFFIRYRYAGKPDQLTIGPYPELSLKEARDRSLHYRSILISGKNPKIQKKLEITKTIGAMTFSELIELWYEKEAAVRIKRHKPILNAIKLHLYPAFENVPIEDITTHHFLDALDNVAKRSPHQVQSLISNVRKAYSLAIRRRITSDNPLVGISSNLDFSIQRNEVDRSLDDEELKLLFKYIENAKSNKRSAIIFLALFYGCRMSELQTAKIEHFDFFNMKWTVPPENHKTGRKTKKSIVRPIIKEIIPFIELLIGYSDDQEHLITSQKTKTMMEPSFWSKYPAVINRWLQRNGYRSIDKWSMHDLRRTQRTNMSTIAQPHICEIMLGHKLPGVWQTYDRHNYIDEQKEAYSKWWDRIQSIKSESYNVTSIAMNQ